MFDRTSALEWWRQTGSTAAFTRVRQLSVLRLLTTAAAKWADAYLIAFASGHQGQLVTFDRALKNRGADCLVLR
jgi:predicted nucleic acid-binding protein